MTFQTNSIILRDPQVDDKEKLSEFAEADAFDKLFGYHLSAQEVEKVLSRPEVYAIFYRFKAELAGYIALSIGADSTMDIADDEAELSYWICDAYMKTVWAGNILYDAIPELQRYAFDNLHLSKLWCRYENGDELSKKSLERYEFEHIKTECKQSGDNADECYTEHITCFTIEKWRQFMSVPGSTKFNPVVYVADGHVLTRDNGIWVRTDGYFNGIIR